MTMQSDWQILKSYVCMRKPQWRRWILISKSVPIQRLRKSYTVMWVETFYKHKTCLNASLCPSLYWCCRAGLALFWCIHALVTDFCWIWWCFVFWRSDYNDVLICQKMDFFTRISCLKGVQECRCSMCRSQESSHWPPLAAENRSVF